MGGWIGVMLCLVTLQATAPSSEQTLAGGAIRFQVPDGLVLLGKRTDDLSASCAPADESALLTLVVTPQQSTVEDSLGRKLGQLIVKTINEQAAKGEIESITPPKIEPDKRFILRVHDRFRSKGKTGDRVQLFRGVGKYLVSVTATDFSGDAEAAKLTHARGEKLALSVKLDRPGRTRAPATTRPASTASRPISFPEARVRLSPPTGWEGEISDRPSGVIATWRDPQDRTNLLAASVRQIPKEARSDPALRDAIVDEIVAGEKQSFVIDGAEPAGQTQTIADKRFLRKLRTDYEAKGVKFRVTSRQIRVGQTILSVTMVALQDGADAIDAQADKLALDARALSTAP